MKTYLDHKTADGVPLRELGDTYWTIGQAGNDLQEWALTGVQVTHMSEQRIALHGSSRQWNSKGSAMIEVAFATKAGALQQMIRVAQAAANKTLLELTTELAKIGGAS